jgi:hypothetical protein
LLLERMVEPPCAQKLNIRVRLKKKELLGALIDIYHCGIECQAAIAGFQATIANQVANAAIPGLAKILGTYRSCFDDTDETERTKLFQLLV